MQQELAWASYALLLNTNICGLAAFWDGQAVLVRGLLRVPSLNAPSGSDRDKAAARVLAALSSTELAAASSKWQQGVLYCPDRTAMGRAGAGSWGCVPEGAEAVLVQPLRPLGGTSATAAAGDQLPNGAGTCRGVLLLLSERPRALSGRERAWSAAVAAKLQSALADATL